MSQVCKVLADQLLFTELSCLLWYPSVTDRCALSFDEDIGLGRKGRSYHNHKCGFSQNLFRYEFDVGLSSTLPFSIIYCFNIEG